MAIQFERIDTPGVAITGDVDANGIVTPFAVLPMLSGAERTARGVKVASVPDVVTRPAQISKRIFVERLHAADKFVAALNAIGGPGSYPYERWAASTYVNTSHPEVLGLIAAIGGDPDTLLAQPTQQELNS